MKTLEEIQAAANKAWMAYENDMGDDFLAFTDAFVAAFEPLLEAERAKNAALVTLLTTMKDNADQNDLDDATFRRWVFDAASYRLAANEKGGANG